MALALPASVMQTLTKGFNRTLPRWQRIAGYTLFGILSFFLCLFLTFPHQAFWARVNDAATAAGYRLKVGDYGAGFGGITGYRVELLKAGAVDSAEPGLLLDSLSLRPTLLPPGLAFKVKGFGGAVSGSVEGFALLKLGTAPPAKADSAGTAEVHLDIDEVDLSKGNLKSFSGIDLGGELNGVVNLSIPVSGQPGAPMYALDFGQSKGTVSLKGESLMINGGTVTVPMMGEPTPMDLPKVGIGNLDGLITFDKGTGTIEKFQTKSEELEIRATGTLKLAKKLDYSVPAVDIRLKAEPALTSRLGLIGSGLSILPADKTDPSFRIARWSGYLSRPRFGPGNP
jgi:type II secretion system protein N